MFYLSVAFKVAVIITYSMDCHEILYRLSWSPEDDSYQFLWSPECFSSTTMTLTFVVFSETSTMKFGAHIRVHLRLNCVLPLTFNLAPPSGQYYNWSHMTDFAFSAN